MSNCRRAGIFAGVFVFFATPAYAAETALDLRGKAAEVRRGAADTVIADRSARAAELQGWLSLIASGVSFVSIVLVVGSLRKATEANKISRVSAYNSQRAYVGTTGAAIVWPDNAIATILVDYQNFGQTLATNVETSIGLSLSQSFTERVYTNTTMIGLLDPGMINHAGIRWFDRPNPLALAGHFMNGCSLFVFFKITYADHDGKRHEREIVYHTQSVVGTGNRLALEMWPNGHHERNLT
jgi:hypothetical protein